MEEYSRKNQLRAYFNNLISDILIHRPTNPIEYLISKLSHNRQQRLFYINFF